jgi:hypothetical protein
LPPGRALRRRRAYFDRLERQRVEQRLVHRLERLGYKVALAPRTETPALAA